MTSHQHGSVDDDYNPSPSERYRDDPTTDDTDGIDDIDAVVSRQPAAEFDGLAATFTRPPTWRKRLEQRIPPRMQHAWAATVEWAKGPQPPRPFSITPLFPDIQHAPLALLDRYAPKKVHRVALLILLYACWLLSFSLILWRSSAAEEILQYGKPVRLHCGARYWNDGNGCGLDGSGCRPFVDAAQAFMCPADCHLTQMLAPHAVGDQEVVYKPLVVGGPTENQTGFEHVVVNNAVYRGDSFICASAIHAGFIDKREGGCGVLTLTGEQRSFTASQSHGVASVGLDSYFPHSFGFLEGSRAQCKDLRWAALAPTLIFTILISVFTTSPLVFFWSIFVVLFFHVGLASDPPSLTDYSSLISLALGRFLPACFCAWVTYRYTVKRSLTGLTAQLEKTVLWLGPAWVGALNNYTFDHIPIQRLTGHDIKAQPGAIPALIFIVLALVAIALGQAWAFRLEGRMPRYLAIYGTMVLALLIMVALPGLNLRIHHYILALLFLPGTSFQNRPSLVYQGLLVGLFVNGVARWGFASILETPAALLADFAQDSLLPTVAIAHHGLSNITFDMGPLPVDDPDTGATYDGISVLVNDVERFRGYADDRSAWDESRAGQFRWTWMRHRFTADHLDVDERRGPSSLHIGTNQAPTPLPEYFRFAYMAGSHTADYTKAGKWDSEGRWTEMDLGPS